MRGQHSGITPAESTAFQKMIRTALAEDFAYGPDITTESTVDASAEVEATFRTRSAGIAAGIPQVRAVLSEVVGGGYTVLEQRGDGTRLDAGDSVLRVRAPARALFSAERTALNLLCHLSGIATLTDQWVSAVDGTKCQIRDSRKTLPGLRLLQKYAVRCGGGVNHRLGLGDAILIKDNHIAAVGSAAEAVRLCRAKRPDVPVEVEVGSLAELETVLPLQPELVLLDNMDAALCAQAVELAADSGVLLEASGGLSLGQAREYAKSGVDFLAVGALTHSAPALDVGLDVDGA